MSTNEKILEAPMLGEAEQKMAAAAQRCLMASLDHSRAAAITVSDEAGVEAKIEVPPGVLRLLANVLGMMSEGHSVSLVPENRELSTIEAAAFLNVSRPFLVKELEQGKMPFRKVGSHRRIEFRAVMAYRDAMRNQSEAALQRMADAEREMGLDY
ncbi:MAG TPA: excisionase family DNA-binding protein [Ideonella sp.]|uniref:excisionase family DNA-binding protein n=1 Tax=Ideonella sp. TaxID=1929293 RepID=UPI002BF3E307|nr:excisionase family DNA-binding protein [Ideonella sp.]HSI51024.1 excisionase family DNA-binding protein [Ideonella sp.]